MRWALFRIACFGIALRVRRACDSLQLDDLHCSISPLRGGGLGYVGRTCTRVSSLDCPGLIWCDEGTAIESALPRFWRARVSLDCSIVCRVGFSFFFIYNTGSNTALCTIKQGNPRWHIHSTWFLMKGSPVDTLSSLSPGPVPLRVEQGSTGVLCTSGSVTRRFNLPWLCFVGEMAC